MVAGVVLREKLDCLERVEVNVLEKGKQTGMISP